MAPARGRDRQPAPPAAGEEIDRRDHERQQCRDQNELDRPTPKNPGAEIDVARGSLHELRSLVESAEKLLRAATYLREAPAVDSLRCVRRAVRPAIVGRSQRYGSDAVPEDGPLLVEREREGQVEQLRERARSPRKLSRLLQD